MFYFTLLSIFKALPFEENYLFEEIFSTTVSITPNENFDILSYQCLLDHFKIAILPAYAKVVTSLLFLITFFFLIAFVKLITKGKSKHKSSQKINFFKKIIIFMKSAFLIYFTDNIIFLFNGLVPLLICVNVGDEQHV